MKNLRVVSVQKIAWNCERVELSSDDADITLNIKNPELHGTLSIGDDSPSMFNDDERIEELMEIKRENEETIKDLQDQLTEALKIT